LPYHNQGTLWDPGVAAWLLSPEHGTASQLSQLPQTCCTVFSRSSGRHPDQFWPLAAHNMIALGPVEGLGWSMDRAFLNCVGLTAAVVGEHQRARRALKPRDAHAGRGGGAPRRVGSH